MCALPTWMYPCFSRAVCTQPGTSAGNDRDPLEFSRVHLPFRLTVC